MFAYLVAFLSQSLWAASNIIDSHISNNMFKRIYSLVFFCVITNILVIPFLFFFGVPKLPSLSTMPFLLGAAALEFLYLFPYYLAMRKIDTSIIIALFGLGKIIIPLLAFCLVGEVLQPVQYLGFFIVVITSVVISLEPSQKLKINSAFWLMCLCSLMYAFQIVFMKRALQEIDWVTNLFWMSLITFTLGLTLLISQKNRADIFGNGAKFFERFSVFILNEGLSQLGNMANNFALAAIPVVIYSAIGATQPMFVLLFCYISKFILPNCFKENLDRANVVKKLTCFIFIVVGVILTVWGK